MRLISRLGLFAVMVVTSFTFLTDTADAQLFPIFKCRKKACCCKPAEPAPEPECTPEPAPEPAPVCCPAPEPAPEPVCCPAPAPEPEPEPAPVCCAMAAPVEVPAEPEPEPVAEPAPCCCCCCGTAAPATDSAEASGTSAEIAEYGMPELAEGEVLVSISPIEIPTDDGTSTLTSGDAN